MTDSTRTTLSDRFDQAVFDAIYSRALVYNTCREDPAVDRQVLGIGPDDRMLVITSVGCNVLDYALLGPECIHEVDANPRQNALLELKLAGIRRSARRLRSSGAAADLDANGQLDPIAPAHVEHARRPSPAAQGATGACLAMPSVLIKATVNFVGEFEQAVSHAVKQHGVDGVICGHIHAATVRGLEGITSINRGDWVDSCTAVAEDADGHMQLIEWGVVPRHAGRNALGEAWSSVRPTANAAQRGSNC